MAGTTSQFEDGSVLTYDGDGNVISHVDAYGNDVAVPPPEGSGVVQQFRTLFDVGVRAYLDDRFRSSGGTPTPGTPGAPGAPQPTQAPWQRFVPVLLFLGGALLVAYVLKKA